MLTRDGAIRATGCSWPAMSGIPALITGMNERMITDQLKMILRASPSGSSTIRQSLSQSIV